MTFCWSLRLSTLTHAFRCAKMSTIHSTGGNVFTFSATSLACSCASRSLASTTFIYGFPMSSSHTLVLSSKIIAHSSSNFLILETTLFTFWTVAWVVYAMPLNASRAYSFNSLCFFTIFLMVVLFHLEGLFTPENDMRSHVS
jgi:hypothetical protein